MELASHVICDRNYLDSFKVCTVNIFVFIFPSSFSLAFWPNGSFIFDKMNNWSLADAWLSGHHIIFDISAKDSLKLVKRRLS